MAKPMAGGRRVHRFRPWRCVCPSEGLALATAYATWDQAMLAVEEAEDRSWAKGWLAMPQAAWDAFMASWPDDEVDTDAYDEMAHERRELQREWVARAMRRW